jgi:hypothetical protein
MGLLLEACTLASISNPSDLLSLPGNLPDLWLAHAKNKIQGRYTRREKKSGPSGMINVRPEVMAEIQEKLQEQR